MNLLENYLKEIISVEPLEKDWTKEEWAKDKEWLKVVAKFNCYGNEKVETHYYSKEEWEDIKEKGYYMG